MPGRSGTGRGTGTDRRRRLVRVLVRRDDNGISLHHASAHVALLSLVLASLLPFLALEPLSTNAAIIASIVVVVIVLIAWKFVKLAFKIALVVAAAIAIFLALQWANIL